MGLGSTVSVMSSVSSASGAGASVSSSTITSVRSISLSNVVSISISISALPAPILRKPLLKPFFDSTAKLKSLTKFNTSFPPVNRALNPTALKALRKKSPIFVPVSSVNFIWPAVNPSLSKGISSSNILASVCFGSLRYCLNLKAKTLSWKVIFLFVFNSWIKERPSFLAASGLFLTILKIKPWKVSCCPVVKL